jgi:hypothetical protein
MAAVTTTTAATAAIRQNRQTPSRSLRKPVSTASTPNLKSSYLSHGHPGGAAAAAPTANARHTPRALALSRKSSLAALTASSLASIPDASDNYAFDAALIENIHKYQNNNMPPGTPGRAAADDVVVGDVIDVPGGMLGTVRFVGAVQGKKGAFVGVELDPDFANRGKNSGDVDGYVSYSLFVFCCFLGRCANQLCFV